MARFSFKPASIALCVSVMATAPAWAQPEPAVTMPAEKVSPQIRPVEVGSPVAAAEGASGYKCGGIGSDESNTMRAEMKNHPLALLFARSGGAYLANVDVAIQGKGSAPALNFKASGPVCLVDLPAGTYEVKATSDGVAKNQSVVVGAGSKTVDFRF